MVAHDGLPVLPDEHYEDGGKGVTERVEIGTRWQTSLEISTTVHSVVFDIEPHTVPKKFHPKQRENSHTDEKQDRECSDLAHSEHDCVKKLAESLPATSQFEDSKQSNTAKDQEGIDLVDSDVWDVENYEVDKGDNHKGCIENVEGIAGVLFETQSDQLDDHFDHEKPDHDVVDKLGDFLPLGVARVRIEPEHDRVQNDEDRDEHSEQKVRANCVTGPIQAVVFGTLRYVQVVA